MIPAQIVWMVRSQTGTPINEIPDVDQVWPPYKTGMYSFLNFVYQKLWYSIVDIDKNYWRQSRQTNLLNTTNQYQLLPAWVNTFWQFKIERVAIKYNTSDRDYTLATEMDRDNFKNATDEMKKNRSFSNPIYVVSADSIFIFPQSLNNVGNWIVLEGVLKPYNLDSTMWESDILIKPEFHDVLVTGVCLYVAQERQQQDLVSFYSQRFELETKKMLDALTIRVLQPVQWQRNNFIWI